jgi:hypothetical protein
MKDILDVKNYVLEAERIMHADGSTSIDAAKFPCGLGVNVEQIHMTLLSFGFVHRHARVYSVSAEHWRELVKIAEGERVQ